MRIRRRVADPLPQQPPGTSLQPPSSPSPSPVTALGHPLQLLEENHWVRRPTSPSSSPCMFPLQRKNSLEHPIAIEREKSEQEIGLPSRVYSSAKTSPGEDNEKKTVVICKKGDGKGWQCKREAQWGYSLCQHHLEKLRSYGGCSRRKKAGADPAADSAPIEPQKRSKRIREGNGRQKKPLRISDSFYYYSGFGPLWRKRKSDVEQLKEEVVEEEEEAEAEDGDEEDGEEESEEAGGKPVKSRALSSIL